MDDFLNQEYRIKNLSLGNEAPLIFRNEVREMRLKVGCKDFSYDFVRGIAEEMGLNLEKEEGQFSLGIRARKVEFVMSPIFFFLCTHRIILIRSFLMTSQKV